MIYVDQNLVLGIFTKSALGKLQTLLTIKYLPSFLKKTKNLAQ